MIDTKPRAEPTEIISIRVPARFKNAISSTDIKQIIQFGADLFNTMDATDETTEFIAKHAELAAALRRWLAAGTTEEK